MSAHQSAASLPINDHYVTTTLALEHLESAESLFTVIMALLLEGDIVRTMARVGA